MNRFFNSLPSHVTVVSMVMVDLLVVTALLLIDQGIICDPESSVSSESGSAADDKGDSTVDNLQYAEDALHIIQLIFLSVFLFKACLRVIAAGMDMFEDKWQIFDCLVVVVTFSMYVALTAAIQSRTVTYALGYVIALRLWRLARIRTAIVEPVKREADKVVISHRKTLRHAEDQLKSAHAKLELQQKEIEMLQSHVQRLRQQGTSSPVDQQPPSYLHPHDLCIEDDYSIDSSSPHTYSKHVNQNGRLPNSYMPHHGSEPTSAVHSIPGTPQSMSSIRHIENEHSDNTTSDRSSNKFPDIVEDTQPSMYSTVNEQRVSNNNTGEDVVNNPHNGNENERENSDLHEQFYYNFTTDDAVPVNGTVDSTNTKPPQCVDISHQLLGHGSDLGENNSLSSQHSKSSEDNNVYKSDNVQAQYQPSEVPRIDNREIKTTSNGQNRSQSKDCIRLANTHRGLSQDSIALPGDTKRSNHVTSMSDTETELNDLDMSVQSHSVPNLAEGCDGYNIKETKRTLSKGVSESEIHKEKDKQRLLRGKSSTLGHVNPAFGVSMTEEEFREIQRISQVPFDDSIHEKDGIPMTDL